MNRNPVDGDEYIPGYDVWIPKKMRNYLSFGGGVNSVALYLLLMEQGLESGNAETGFEAVYCHMPDYPATHEHILLMESRGYPITIIQAMPTSKLGKAYDANLYQYCLNAKMMPGFKRWCTMNFKVLPLQTYYQKPCFEMVGISTDESKRAVLRTEAGVERRYPLIEAGMSRQDCKALIRRHGLPVPPKSGCFFCPYQRKAQWQELRRKHPDLYCKALALEKITGRNLPISNKPLETIVNEKDRWLFSDMAYEQPCECGL